MENLLERLSNACGVSGLEDEVRAVLEQSLSGCADDIWTDVMGNLIVRKGSGPVRVLLDAHMDEVGFLVGSITDEGYVRLKKIGGLDDRVLPGRHVWLTSRRIPGVIGVKAWHLTMGEERSKAVPFDRMFVDLGARSRAEVEMLGIEPGEPVCFATTFERYSERVVKGKAFDDRAGCTALTEIIRQADFPDLTVYGVFATQEEVGLRGSRVAAYNLNPDLAIALEGTVSANVPGVDPADTVTNMGEGPVISLMDAAGIPSLRLFELLVRAAGEAGIRHQYRRLTSGGTDAGAIALQRKGVRSATVSVPCRYIHTGAALLNLDDLNGAAALVHRFLANVAKGEFRP